MALKCKHVSPTSPYYAEVLRLYQSAFPEVERLPIAWLNEQAKTARGEWLAYFDDNQFCGFTYSLISEKVHYLLFLAVAEKKTSQGYGTKILEVIAKGAGNRLSALVIEPLDKQAKNYSQRLKRLAFYQRNGYQLTSYRYYENQEAYQVLSNKLMDDYSDFLALAKVIEEAGIKIKVD